MLMATARARMLAGRRKAATLISIIMPVYNTAPFVLERAIRSVLSQTYSGFELIVVDDGSDSKCACVLDSISCVDARVRVIHSFHHGVSHARNIGLDCAVGSWIAFSDSDDEYRPDFLRDALSVAMKKHVDLVCGNVDVLYRNRRSRSKNSGCVRVYKDERSLKGASLQVLGGMRNKLFDGPLFNVGPCAKLFNAKAIGSLRFDEGMTYGEDAHFLHSFIRQNRAFAYVDADWYLYYQNDGSTVRVSDLGFWRENIKSILRLMDNAAELPGYKTMALGFAFRGVTNNINNESISVARENSIELLRFAADSNCFDWPVLAEFNAPILVRAMTWLCSKRAFDAAFWFWLIKTRAANTIKGDNKLFNSVKVDLNRSVEYHA